MNSRRTSPSDSYFRQFLIWKSYPYCTSSKGWTWKRFYIAAFKFVASLAWVLTLVLCAVAVMSVCNILFVELLLFLFDVVGGMCGESSWSVFLLLFMVLWVPISAMPCRRAVLMLWHAFLLLGLRFFPPFFLFAWWRMLLFLVRNLNYYSIAEVSEIWCIEYDTYARINIVLKRRFSRYQKSIEFFYFFFAPPGFGTGREP
jgi:hypothetical protein